MNTSASPSTPERRPQKVIVLEVQDTGTGIPADVQESLFDPFFTTKASGTGLAIARTSRTPLSPHGGARFKKRR
jgi:signal transduction histidine kinase